MPPKKATGVAAWVPTKPKAKVEAKDPDVAGSAWFEATLQGVDDEGQVMVTYDDYDNAKATLGVDSVRIRSTKGVMLKDVHQGVVILANYNLDKPKEAGFWYDAIIVDEPVQSKNGHWSVSAQLVIGEDSLSKKIQLSTDVGRKKTANFLAVNSAFVQEYLQSLVESIVGSKPSGKKRERKTKDESENEEEGESEQDVEEEWNGGKSTPSRNTPSRRAKHTESDSNSAQRLSGRTRTPTKHFAPPAEEPKKRPKKETKMDASEGGQGEENAEENGKKTKKPKTKRAAMVDSSNGQDGVEKPKKKSKKGDGSEGGEKKPNGQTCHQCRQSIFSKKGEADMRQGKIRLRCSFCTLWWCESCSRGRYQIDIRAMQVIVNQGGTFRCPSCETDEKKRCNCSNCRAKNGLPPTGILAHHAKDKGFGSVAEFLAGGDDEVAKTLRTKLDASEGESSAKESTSKVKELLKSSKETLSKEEKRKRKQEQEEEKENRKRHKQEEKERLAREREEAKSRSEKAKAELRQRQKEEKERERELAREAAAQEKARLKEEVRRHREEQKRKVKEEIAKKVQEARQAKESTRRLSTNAPRQHYVDDLTLAAGKRLDITGTPLSEDPQEAPLYFDMLSVAEFIAVYGKELGMEEPGLDCAKLKCALEMEDGDCGLLQRLCVQMMTKLLGVEDLPYEVEHLSEFRPTGGVLSGLMCQYAAAVEGTQPDVSALLAECDFFELSSKARLRVVLFLVDEVLYRVPEINDLVSQAQSELQDLDREQRQAELAEKKQQEDAIGEIRTRYFSTAPQNMADGAGVQSGGPATPSRGNLTAEKFEEMNKEVEEERNRYKAAIKRVGVTYAGKKAKHAPYVGRERTWLGTDRHGRQYFSLAHAPRIFVEEYAQEIQSDPPKTPTRDKAPTSDEDETQSSNQNEQSDESQFRGLEGPPNTYPVAIYHFSVDRNDEVVANLIENLLEKGAREGALKRRLEAELPHIRKRGAGQAGPKRPAKVKVADPLKTARSQAANTYNAVFGAAATAAKSTFMRKIERSTTPSSIMEIVLKSLEAKGYDPADEETAFLTNTFNQVTFYMAYLEHFFKNMSKKQKEESGATRKRTNTTVPSEEESDAPPRKRSRREQIESGSDGESGREEYERAKENRRKAREERASRRMEARARVVEEEEDEE